jgi:hypothetical protein
VGWQMMTARMRPRGGVGHGKGVHAWPAEGVQCQALTMVSRRTDREHGGWAVEKREAAHVCTVLEVMIASAGWRTVASCVCVC